MDPKASHRPPCSRRQNNRHCTWQAVQRAGAEADWLSHDHSLKRKEPMPPSVRLCDHCEEQDPTRRCQDCGLLYCDTCCTTVHDKGTFTSHSISSARCDSCEEAVSELSCADCGCTKCSTKVHSKGNLKKHKPASPRTATLGVNLAQFLCKLIVPASSPQEN